MKKQKIIENEENARKEADEALQAALDKEIKRSTEADTKHDKEIERLDDEKASYKFVDKMLKERKAALDEETKERKAADKALEKSLIDTYNGLNNRLLDEVGTRAKEDAKLATKIKKKKMQEN
ncbi:hypothetical protein HMPREF9466_02962 [Fusobacterium necrophorum subsp. funduliforme 1_1_36S]|nr:hypothetical protein HMPREF9466_02962 [Fusobacterium necrophorum subsp. funduliforme 1_1_36S]